MLEKLGILLNFIGGEQAVTGMGRVSRGMEGMQRGGAKISAGISQVGAVLTPMLIGAGVGIAGTVQRFATFEQGIAKIGTVLPGGSKEAWGFANAIEKSSLKFGRGAADVSEGLNSILQANISAADSLPLLDVAMQASTAGFVETKDAVTGLTAVINAYHLPVAEATKISDQMFKAVMVGNMTFQEISGVIGKVASTAAMGRVGFDELSAALATMTLTGLSADESATAINQALLAFVKPAKEATTVAKKYGIELSLNALRSKGFLRAIGEINAKIGDNEEQLAAIFGNVRAFRAAAALAVGQGAKQFEDILGQVRAAAGITKRNFEDVSQTIKFKFGQALAVADAMARQVGASFAKVFGLAGLDPVALAGKLERIGKVSEKFFTGVKSGLETVVHWLGRFGISMSAVDAQTGALEKSTLPETIGKLTGLGATFGIVALAIGPVVSALSGLWTIVSGLGSVISGAVESMGGLGGALGSWGGPVGAILAVIAGDIIAIVTNVQGAGTAFGVFWESLKSIGMGLWEILKPIFGYIEAMVGTIMELRAAFIAPILDSLGRGFLAVGQALEPLLPYLQGVYAVGILLFGLFKTVAIPVVSFLAEVFGGAFRIALEGVAFLIENVVTGLDKLVGLIRDVITAIADFFGYVVEIPSIGDKFKINVPPPSKYVHPGVTLEETLAGAAGATSEAYSEITSQAAKETKVQVNSHLHVDGKAMNVASSRAQLELTERAGANVTPWQRRLIVEQGASIRPAGAY